MREADADRGSLNCEPGRSTVAERGVAASLGDPGRRKKRNILDWIVQRDEISRPVAILVAVLIVIIGSFPARIVQQWKKNSMRGGFAEAEITSARALNDAKAHTERKSRKYGHEKFRALAHGQSSDRRSGSQSGQHDLRRIGAGATARIKKLLVLSL